MSLPFIQKIYIRKALKQYFEIQAKLKGEVFLCEAINGKANYDISINSDMSVSCNAQDYDGSGHIGNLEESTLQEIFQNKKTKQLRKTLSEGKLPLLICARCPRLKRINKTDANKVITEFSVPRKGIMVENTVACDCQCKSCERESVVHTRKKINLSLDDMKKIAKEVKDNKIESVCFFNLGEPFLSPNITKELEILKKDNKDLYISLSTNGLYVDGADKQNAIKFLDHITFSIDGMSNEILRKYQTKGNFERSYTNMKDLVEYRKSLGLEKPVIEWKYVLFNWNDKEEYINKAIEMAKKAKVDVISFWPTSNPLLGTSWRYYFSDYFKKIGTKNKRGVILVEFRKGLNLYAD